MTLAALAGFVLGFISAVPIAGPVSAFVFSQGMKGRFSQGRWAALGAAWVEGVYCFLALWGFNRLVPEFKQLFFIANAVAAVVLGTLGVYFLRSKKMRHPTESKSPVATRTIRAFLLGTGICAANPSLIATWAASSATIYSMDLFPFTVPNAGVFSGGVALGIFTWFSVFLRLVGKYRDRFDDRVLDKILKGFGAVLISLAIAMVYRLVTHRP